METIDRRLASSGEFSIWQGMQVGMTCELHLIACTSVEPKVAFADFTLAVGATFTEHAAILDPRFRMVDGSLYVERSRGPRIPTVTLLSSSGEADPQAMSAARFPDGGGWFRFFVVDHPDRTVVYAIGHHIATDASTLDSVLDHVIVRALGLSPDPPHALTPVGAAEPVDAYWSALDLADLEQEPSWSRSNESLTPVRRSHRERIDLASHGLPVDDYEEVLRAAWSAALHSWHDLETIAFLSPTEVGRANSDGWGVATQDVLVVSNVERSTSVEHFVDGLARDFRLALQHADTPPTAGADNFGLRRRPDGSSFLTDYEFSVRRVAPVSTPDLGDHRRLMRQDVPSTPGRSDVALHVVDTGDGGLDLYWDWNGGEEVAPMVTGLRYCFAGLLQQWAEDKTRSAMSISLLQADEVRPLLEAGSGETRSIDNRTAAEAIGDSLKRRGPEVAVESWDGRLTYAELGEAVDRMRLCLQQQDVEPGAHVGVWMTRGVALVPVMVASWAEGCVYVPIDMSSPVEQVLSMLRVVTPTVLVVDHPVERAVGDLATELGIRILDSKSNATDDVGPLAPPVHVGPEAGVYVMFTSGSTGVPKAVEVGLDGFNNHLAEKARLMDIMESDVIGQLAPISFDIHVWQVAAPLIAGGTVRIYSTEDMLDPLLLGRLMEFDEVSILNPVPSYLERWCDLSAASAEVSIVSTVRAVVVTGEAFPTALAEKLPNLFPNAKMINGYGQAECSHDVSHHVVTGGETAGLVPIGRIAANTTGYILDRWDRLRPAGMKGELAIGGVAVGKGYLGQDRRPSFRADPFVEGDGTMYLTGDICSFSDGEYLYHGRRDHQVKIGGRRIELGQVENACLHIPSVRLAAACVAGSNGREALVVFIESEASLTADTIRAHLRGHFPEALIPSLIEVVEHIALSRNGKIDRRGLQVQAQTLLERRSDNSPDNSGPIAHHWRIVLGVGDIKSADNFFSMGGSSLQAIELISLLNEIGHPLTVRDLYEHPQLNQLCALAAELVPASGRSAS